MRTEGRDSRIFGGVFMAGGSIAESSVTFKIAFNCQDSYISFRPKERPGLRAEAH